MLVDKLKKIIKNKFSKKIPISYPVMYGSLLKGKTAFITGGNSGIGLEIAKAFLNNGASVIISGSDKVKLEKVYKNLINEFTKLDDSQNIEYFQIDLLNIKNIQEKINGFIENKRIDILVNSAGIL